MTNFLNRNIGNIFIMLGHGCNMNCRYCLQHPLVEQAISSHINPDIYNFIEQITKENDEDCKLNLHFFGGEPLVYFSAIKKIVENTKHLSVTYSILTNGKNITQEMVDFLNKHNISPGVSWDGKNTTTTRGMDVFAAGSENRKRLLQLNHLGTSSVLSAENYPQEACDAVQELSADYFELHGYSMGFNFDAIMDTGLGDKSLLQMDFDRVEDEIETMMQRYMDYRLNKGKMQVAELALIEPMFNSLYRVMNKKVLPWEKQYCGCGNGYSTLNMDLAGNLYPCHNTSEKAGNIYTPYFKYLKNIIKTDRVLDRQKYCKDCPAMLWCRGGCKMVPPETMENGMCKLRRALFTPVLKAVLAYGNKLAEVKNGEERNNSSDKMD